MLIRHSRTLYKLSFLPLYEKINDKIIEDAIAHIAAVSGLLFSSNKEKIKIINGIKKYHPSIITDLKGLISSLGMGGIFLLLLQYLLE